MKRILIYASVYASIGAVLGVLMALSTKDLQATQALFNGNHRTPVVPAATEQEVTEDARS